MKTSWIKVFMACLATAAALFNVSEASMLADNKMKPDIENATQPRTVSWKDLTAAVTFEDPFEELTKKQLYDFILNCENYEQLNKLNQILKAYT